MKHPWYAFVLLALLASLAAGCATPTPPPAAPATPVPPVAAAATPQVIEKTVIATQIVEKIVTQEVDKWVYITPTIPPVPTTPQRGGTVTITYFQDFGAGFPDIYMDPSGTANFIAAQMYDTLVRFDTTHKVVGNLAKSWEVSQDGKTYTFHLQQGVKFHNGKDFKAEDAVYSLNRFRAPATSVWASSLDPVTKVEASDDYTVQITTKVPYAPLLDKLAYFTCVMYPKDTVPTATSMIGTGPFKLESLVANTTLTLVRNPDYWAKGDQNLPYLDKIVFNYISDEMARFGSLMSNQSDAIYTPPHTARPSIEQSTDYTIYPGFTQYEGIVLNTLKVPAFANPLVREAINIALNRKEIVDVALDGVGTPMLGNLEIPGTYGATATDFLPLQGDIAKAKQLMAQAGYEKGFSFTLSNWELWPTEVKSETLIQSYLAPLNINVTFDHVNEGQWAAKVQKGNIDAVYQGWGSLIDPDFDYRFVFHPTQAYIVNVLKNQQIADMIDGAAKEMDPAKRGQDYSDLVTALYASGQDSYTNVLLLWREPQDIATNVKRLHGFVDDGGYGNLTSLRQMWVSK